MNLSDIFVEPTPESKLCANCCGTGEDAGLTCPACDGTGDAPWVRFCHTGTAAPLTREMLDRAIFKLAHP